MSRPSAPWLLLVAGAVSAGIGCGKGNDYTPVGPGMDASGFDRAVIDAPPPVEHPADGASHDGSSNDGSTDGTVDPTDGLVQDGNAGFSMEIAVLNPAAGPDGGVAPIIGAQSRFTPDVVVTIISTVPTSGDAIGEVTAALFRPIDNVQVAIVTLGQSGIETIAESTGKKYRFSDKPMDLSTLESGTYDLVITSRTVGGAKTEAKVAIQVDAGPSIRIDSPIENKSFRDSAPVDVTVVDVFGTVSKVEMTLGQRPLAFLGPGGPSMTQYTTTIDFNSFNPPLEGDQLLTVRATNLNGTTSVLTRKFLSDSKGPTIGMTVPSIGQLVGKVVTISAEITDPAGVLDSSVVVVIAHGGMTFQRQLDPPAAGSMDRIYRTLFDTSGLLDNNALFPSISFRASDILGNESSVGYLVSFDNSPPLSDLDPPADFRTVFLDSGNVPRCSWALDPVGPDAVDDGERVSQLFDIRARIEDQGNRPKSGGVDFTPIASIEEGKAQLLILDDVSMPLVVDTDGDPLHTCDAINPLLTPTTTPMSSRDALLIQMAQIPVSGASDNIEGDVTAAGLCNQGGAATVPIALCDTVFNYTKVKWRTEFDPVLYPVTPPPQPHSYFMNVAIPYANDRTPAIWTIPPVVTDNLQCAGRQFDSLANNVSDGWACLAVSVTDRLGNHQVSRPLRVCLDHDGIGNECPHKAILQATDTSPIRIETAAAHGYTTGNEVIVAGVFPQTAANGRFTISVVDSTHFSLVGSTPVNRVDPGTGGTVILASQLPDCTGTQTSKGPPPVVTSAVPCNPWRLFPHNELRKF